jgi:hypothetical protein
MRLRVRISSPPTALWPLADAEPLPGTARLAGWLGRTILNLVTGYTRPGDRVLLIAPPEATRAAARSAYPYAGLTEAVWTVTRLGRGTDTATASPAPDDAGDPCGAVGRPHSRSASGSRLGRVGCPTPTDRDHPDLSDPDRVGARPRGTFDLIITAVQPYATGWLAHTDWDSLLADTGTLAVVTHSDSDGGRLRDPIAAIVDTFRSQVRGWLDHIAVLDRPLPAAARVDLTPGCESGRPVTPTAGQDPMPLRRVHHDLLLFGPVPVPQAGRSGPERAESSDD